MTYIGRIWLPLAAYDLYWFIVTLTGRICSQSKVFCRSALLCRFNIPHNTAVAKSLVACRDNNTVCRIWNCKPFALTLRKEMKLAKIENINTIQPIQKFNESKEPEINSKMEPRKSKSELYGSKYIRIWPKRNVINYYSYYCYTCYYSCYCCHSWL